MLFGCVFLQRNSHAGANFCYLHHCGRNSPLFVLERGIFFMMKAKEERDKEVKENCALLNLQCSKQPFFPEMRSVKKTATIPCNCGKKYVKPSIK